MAWISAAYSTVYFFGQYFAYGGIMVYGSIILTLCGGFIWLVYAGLCGRNMGVI